MVHGPATKTQFMPRYNVYRTRAQILSSVYLSLHLVPTVSMEDLSSTATLGKHSFGSFRFGTS